MLLDLKNFWSCAANTLLITDLASFMPKVCMSPMALLVDDDDDDDDDVKDKL